MSVRGEVRRERGEGVQLDVRGLLRPDWGQLAPRFGFGAVIAVGAGLVGIRWGPRAGGVFLAFPALLPAALTLLERSKGVAQTEIDAVGAGLGAVAILLFALVAALAGPRLGVLAVLLAAASWTAAALVLFGLGRSTLKRLTRRS